ILAGRPVITSPVCPALEYIRGAAVEVPPDNIEQYCKAILKLYDNDEFYKQKQEACATLQGQFYDSKNSWAEKLKMLLKRHILKRVYPCALPISQINTQRSATLLYGAKFSRSKSWGSASYGTRCDPHRRPWST